MGQKDSTETAEMIEEKHDVKGYVYFFHSALMNRTKIGKSRWPGSRLDSLSTAVPDLKPVATVGTDDSSWLERCFHTIFAHRREKGEWFRLSEEDLAIVDTLPSYISEPEQFPAAFGILWHMNYHAVEREDGTSRHRVALPANLASLLHAYSVLANSVEDKVAGDTLASVSSLLEPFLSAECERLLAVASDDVRRQITYAMNAHTPARPAA